MPQASYLVPGGREACGARVVDGFMYIGWTQQDPDTVADAVQLGVYVP